jgi:ubiquinone/menaquinone biosynthesis C-methylase UbiE
MGVNRGSLSPTCRFDRFDAIAEDYDAHFTHSLIGAAQRRVVWREMDREFGPGQRILEINCGTGVDALYLAAGGASVVACDASAKMLEVARRRLDMSPHGRHVDLRLLAIEQLSRLAGRYDGVLSNFSGLNCVADLRAVACDLGRLVRPGGRVILCLFGRFCVWEICWYTFRGNLRKALRRLASVSVSANLTPNMQVSVSYHSIGSLRREFAPHFRLLRWRGVGVATPPSYLEEWAARSTGLFPLAARVDPFLGRCPGLRALGDHVLLVFEKV